MTEKEIVEALAKFRRPGSPDYGRHFQGLPAEVIRKENVPVLLGILCDRALPTKVREHAAGALGEIRDARGVRPLIAALGEAGLRRGAAVALGRMQAQQAAEALKPLAGRVKAARWALSRLSPPTTVVEVIEDLRSGQLRHIPRKLRRLPEALGRKVQAQIVRELRRHCDRPGDDVRWCVTALTTFRHPAAPALLARTLTRAWRQMGPVVGLPRRRTCCGCLHQRTLRALKTNPSPQAVGNLAQTVTNRYQGHALMALKRLRELNGGGLSDRQIASMLESTAAIRKPLLSPGHGGQVLSQLARFAGDYGGRRCREALRKLHRRFSAAAPAKAIARAMARIDTRLRRSQAARPAGRRLRR